MKTLYKGDNCSFVSNRGRFIKPLSLSGALEPQTVLFANPPIVLGYSSIGGEKEGKGPMGKYFRRVVDDDKMNEKCFERAELDLLQFAIDDAIDAAGLRKKDVGLMLAGDLLNQITTSSYVARETTIPYMGLYGACSTMSESLALAGMLLNAGYFKTAVCGTVSHFATAERQFRYPLEYGCQRPPYAQWTVTAAGATVLSGDGDGIRLTAATIGRVVDYGIDDLNNMGAAMAPAAVDSVSALFAETATSPEDYDLILTGDLGKLGSDIFRDLMREKGYDMGKNYNDCGCLMFDASQKCYQGGSGCGCSASILNSFVFDGMKAGKYSRVALFATGALMSAQSCFQGETIPCISHGVVFEV